MPKIPEHKPANVTDPWVRFDMELQIKGMKPTDRMRDVMNPDEFKNFKAEMNKKGHE